MIHVGKNTRSRIVSKGISAAKSTNYYRGLVQVGPTADNSRNFSHCDQVKNPFARIEQEASTSKTGEDQLFYFQQRGIDHEQAVAAMICGFCRVVFTKLPSEFSSEVNALMNLKLEGSVG